MADRVSSGQPIPRSANLWNNIIGSANEYASRLLGQPSGTSSQPNPTDVVKIKNSRGSHIRLGEVLEISGFLLTNVLRTSLWFDGDTPNGTRPFAIALQDIPSTSIDRAQVSGACVALVNVTDADHGYAQVMDGEIVLQSASGGPIRIMHKPTGTGEKVCAVLFGAVGGGGNSVATTGTIIPARSGNVPGGPIEVIKKKIVDITASPLAFESNGTVNVYSWVQSPSSDPGNSVLWIFIEQDENGVWWFTGEDCP
jgi:hypothetical protein